MSELEDKVFFFVKDSFSNKSFTEEIYILRGDDSSLRFYINLYMSNNKVCEMKDIIIKKPDFGNAPFIL